MTSYWKRPSPLRNTVLMLLFALMAETLLRVCGIGTSSDFMAMKRFFLLIMLGWAAVDFFSTNPKSEVTDTPANTSAETVETQH